MFYTVSSICLAQVGIGTSTPHASSMLDIQSENTGLLIPRVSLQSTTNASPVNSPAQSLMVYNTNTTDDVTPGFYYWSGTAWVSMRTPAGGGGSNQRTWSMQGNIVTDDDFIGTLENYKPLKFKVDGNAFGQFHPGGGITLGFGAEAFTDDAIAIGRNAKALTSTSIAIGKDASVSVTNSSIAFGENAKVSAHRALAFGFNSEASNLSSLALGAESTASGQASTALGRETNASA